MVPLLKYFVSEWNSGEKIESDHSNGGKFPFKGRLDLHIGMSQKPFGAKPPATTGGQNNNDNNRIKSRLWPI